MRTLRLLTALLLSVPVGASHALADPPNSNGAVAGWFTNAGANTAAHSSLLNFGQQQGAQTPRSGVHPASYLQTFEYRTTLGCGNQTDPDANMDPTSCTMALVFCAVPGDDSRVYYYTWYRERVVSGGGPGPWRFQGAYCSGGALPPGAPAPPAVPSMAQIRQAFAELPFGRPTVAVQPVGGTTLVNLPTFYEVRWDGTGLEPGQVSKAVQLLSWNVEFEVGLGSYDVQFGDGASSGPTLDSGGPYPDGSIRHTYSQPVAAAEVTARTVLTGRFRVTGGAWQDLPGEATLQDLPVTTLHVAEASSRLVSQ